MKRREFLVAAALLPAASVLNAAPSSAAAAGGLSLQGAINRAGRQRMLSQRCAKGWRMLVDGVLPEKAKSILDGSIRLFDQQLVDLRALLPNDEIRSAHQLLESEWGRYRSLLTDIRADAKLVWGGSEATLSAAHKLTLAYERTSGTPAGRLVNLAGRQRMLSQRMAKAYLFRQAGVNPEPAREMLDTAMKEFSKALDELKTAPQNTAQIKSELALVDQQWFFFQNSLSQRAAEDMKRAAASVATTSERILEEMDSVVALYEKL